jgi:aspartate ammonia-lyase
VNRAHGTLDPRIGKAIERACDDLLRGELRNQFVVDVLQGSGAAALNMNANEVIANRALEHLGCAKGRYDIIHPWADVNANQGPCAPSSAAIRIALWRDVDDLFNALRELRGALQHQADPLREAGAGQGSFGGPPAGPPSARERFFTDLAISVAEEEMQLMLPHRALTSISLAESAPEGFSAAVVAELQQDGVKVVEGRQAGAVDGGAALLDVSEAIARLARALSRLGDLFSRGLRFDGSGDRLVLPQWQARHPVGAAPALLDILDQVSFLAAGQHTTIRSAHDSGIRNRSRFDMLSGWTLHRSISRLTLACRTLTHHGIAELRLAPCDAPEWRGALRVQAATMAAGA